MYRALYLPLLIVYPEDRPVVSGAHILRTEFFTVYGIRGWGS